MSFYGVGLTALHAAQIGLQTTSHNIANASTPHFSRQSIVQTTQTALFTGAGFIGQGTRVDTVRRSFDEYLERQVLMTRSGAAEMDAYYAQISQIDNLLADPAAGLSPALADFFKGVQEVAAHPESLPARQAMLAASQALVARFWALDQRFTELRAAANANVTSEVAAINAYAQQIAKINEQIALAYASSSVQPPNDLLDERDRIIAELNEKIGIRIDKQSDGAYNVFLGSGQPLVVGQTAYTFAAATSPEDPSKVMVSLQAPGGSLVYVQEQLLTGGSLGGLIRFRNEILDQAHNALGRIAIVLAQNINDQHQLGMDLLGALGGLFFDIPTTVTPIANANNAGSGIPQVTISNVGALTTSDYRLSYDGTQYTLTRLSDNTAVATVTALPIVNIDGLTITPGAWAPAAGDSVLIQPTRQGAAQIGVAVQDARRIAAAAPIRTSAALTNTGTATISAGVVNGPPPPNANLTQTVTLTFNNPPTSFNVVGTGTGNPTNVPYVSGGNISYNGWTLQISGAPAAGDVFVVELNANGVADNRNAVLMAALQTSNTVAGGTTTYQGAYSQLVSQVGNKTREVKSVGEAQTRLAENAQSARDRFSAVNLDEEAANLIRFQQAYQAAARMIDIASRLFEEILALGR
ncbi:MAG: flagellar hook-associated protein FlgK [Rhodocyclaceae bacterium]|nr:flagellar hook-associated protein FlgK [Rhodocyclaceae bacterium]